MRSELRVPLSHVLCHPIWIRWKIAQSRNAGSVTPSLQSGEGSRKKIALRMLFSHSSHNTALITQFVRGDTRTITLRIRQIIYSAGRHDDSCRKGDEREKKGQQNLSDTVFPARLPSQGKVDHAPSFTAQRSRLELDSAAATLRAALHLRRSVHHPPDS